MDSKKINNVSAPNLKQTNTDSVFLWEFFIILIRFISGIPLGLVVYIFCINIMSYLGIGSFNDGGNPESLNGLVWLVTFIFLIVATPVFAIIFTISAVLQATLKKRHPSYTHKELNIASVFVVAISALLTLFCLIFLM